jgi:hypothetical protein
VPKRDPARPGATGGGRTTHEHGTLKFQRYRLAGSKGEYYPDLAEPIDRWYQAANSSNVDTTRRLILNLADALPALIVDPFVGAGSTAVAARLLNVPFFGIDVDPVLTCVTLAKAWATREHVRQLSPGDTVLSVEPDPVLNCLNLVRRLRAEAGDPIEVAQLASDVERCPAPHADTRVCWGDSTTDRAWVDTPVASGPKVIYCSPPFDLSSPRPAVSAAIVDHARRILVDAGLARLDEMPPVFGHYHDLSTGMLNQAREHLGRATVLMEHEPPDSKVDQRSETARRFRDDAHTDIREILENREAFSPRGRLSLFRGEFGG